MTFRGSSAANSQKPVNGMTFFVGRMLPQVAGGEWFSLKTGDFHRLRLPFQPRKSLHCFSMSLPAQPNVKLINAPDYREAYANSVQMRVNVWDFFMVFGTLQQQTETQVEIRNFQGIYLSPQQAKALLGLSAAEYRLATKAHSAKSSSIRA